MTSLKERELIKRRARCERMGHRWIRGNHRQVLLCVYCDGKIRVEQARRQGIKIFNPDWTVEEP